MSFLVLQGDARQIPLRDESVHMVCCSPPYWNLRNYGVNGQIGLEATVEEYVSQLVAVFREVKRCLHKTGCLFLNLSDSYRDKQLCGVPWKVAFALQEEGWILRSDIIWAKLNPMPESVSDRPTRAHEYIFLLTKSEQYFWDQEAVREPHVTNGKGGFNNKARLKSVRLGASHAPSLINAQVNSAGRNPRSVWSIPSERFPGQHFAVMPTELVKRCVLAGSSEHGCCSACGASVVRVVEKAGTGRVYERGACAADWRAGTPQHTGSGSGALSVQTRTLGWQPSCSCNAPTTPAVIFDPFAGSGTVGLVSSRLGRNSVMMDLNVEYCAMAQRRIVQDAPLLHFAETQQVSIHPVAAVAEDLFAWRNR